MHLPKDWTFLVILYYVCFANVRISNSKVKNMCSSGMCQGVLQYPLQLLHEKLNFLFCKKSFIDIIYVCLQNKFQLFKQLIKWILGL